MAPSRSIYAVPPELRQRSPTDRSGLLKFTAPGSGTYWLGSKGVAWMDFVEQGQNSVRKPRSYEWTTFRERRMEARLFELSASTRYLVRISASPEATSELFLAGPLRP